MHSMLLVLDQPPDDTTAAHAWHPFLTTVAQRIAPIPGVDTLGANCWVLSVDHLLQVHEQIVLAQQGTPFHFVYRVLFLTAAPQWLRSSRETTEIHP